MTQQIFVSMAVKDVQKSKEFFTKLGFTFNEKFSGPTSLCITISDTVYVMMVARDLFQTFTDKEITDATKSVEMQVGLCLESREAVDSLVDRAVAAGANEGRPAQDEVGMYSRDFGDLDGHTWGIMYMEPNSTPQQ